MSVPSHVPAELVREFDFFAAPELASAPHREMRRFHRDAPGIFYTPLNGGHWVVTRSAVAVEMLRKPALFSSDPKHNEANRRWPRTAPNQYDPPEHTNFRLILNPWFSPGIVARRTEEIRALSASLIDGVVDRGACEFVAEIGELFPVTIFLRMVDAPLEDRETLIELAGRFVRGETAEIRKSGLSDLAIYVEQLAAKRRLTRGNDLISHILAARIGDKALDEEELLGLITLVFLGGLDTVTATLSFIMYYLVRHPEQYARLRDAPEMIVRATEELMRAHGVATTERGVVEDTVFAGVQFRAGDRVIFLPPLFGLDDQAVDRPDDIDFDREDVRHLVFGAGVHRCIGSHLARIEIHVFLEEWFKRIPEATYAGSGEMATRGGRVWTPVALPIRWSVPPARTGHDF